MTCLEVCSRLFKGLYEPHQQAFVNSRAFNVTGEQDWCTRLAVHCWANHLAFLCMYTNTFLDSRQWMMAVEGM